jgi:hypothetical protein
MQDFGQWVADCSEVGELCFTQCRITNTAVECPGQNSFTERPSPRLPSHWLLQVPRSDLPMNVFNSVTAYAMETDPLSLVDESYLRAKVKKGNLPLFTL